MTSVEIQAANIAAGFQKIIDQILDLAGCSPLVEERRTEYLKKLVGMKLDFERLKDSGGRTILPQSKPPGREECCRLSD